MAMEDALVLDEELVQADVSNIPVALERFVKRRSERVKYSKKLTRKMGSIVETKSFFLGTLEELLIRFMPIRHFTKNYGKLLREPI